MNSGESIVDSLQRLPGKSVMLILIILRQFFKFQSDFKGTGQHIAHIQAEGIHPVHRPMIR